MKGSTNLMSTNNFALNPGYINLQEESLVKPRGLWRGSKVGVFAPSMPTSSWFPDRLNHALAALAETLGVSLVVAPNVKQAFHGFVAGSARQRAEIFNSFVADPEVSAVFCSIGGFNSAEILPYIDMDLARRNPKILVGYSDTTALLLGLQAQAGWITFHGPSVMTQFGEFPSPHEFTISSLRDSIENDLSGMELRDPEGWTSERLEWGTGAWRTRARYLTSPANRTVWRAGAGGKVVGRLWGGNIETFNLMLGTPYLAVPESIILFWEATEAEAFLPRVRRALVQLDQSKILDRTKAMLIGRSPDCEVVSGVSLHDVVLEATKEFDFPIVANIAFGHTDPILTLPVGVSASVEISDLGASIHLLEAAVSNCS